ncbi:TRAP transporter small permease [Phyllobacterium sp. 0TCS1.6C]|uniref:TRAP transporter small permease n=1 Tax=unclassified Phyllobacterium TaxID=2638441 RepID=UPI00226492EB|nr:MULTISPECIES: TRAP transporter small permease [unclassified Phyllobacterium]MCX8280137.1 TRAP transporter small permease [Phyllobacterium sp. 0TCS1.6C]MCX8294301.1 TRAP transporter small permease [Phyllobacterium sp. 0TCS1.6A]
MLKRLVQLELAICFALLAGITGLVFVAAIMRFFGHPLIWSVDMAQLLFIWLCFIGANKAMREKSHLGMEVLVSRLRYQRRFWLEVICAVIIIAFLAVLALEGWRLTWLNRERTFGDSTLSYAWVTVAVPVGCVLLGATLVHNMVRAFRGQREELLVYNRTPAEIEASAPTLEL